MRRARAPVSLFLGLAPFALVAVGARALVPHLAEEIARPLAAVASAASFEVLVVDPPELPPGPKREPTRPFVSPRPADPPGDARGRPPGERSFARAAAPPRPRDDVPEALFISDRQLLRLAPDRLRAVRWSDVRDPRGAPLGVGLSGVGALGVGLADGDLVVSIDGRRTGTAEDATAAGLAAWNTGARSVQAKLLRSDRVIAVTLQLPPH